MEHAAETGYSRQRNRRGFESKDPFTLSITHHIQSNRSPVQGIDDVLLPSPINIPSQPSPSQSYGLAPPIHQAHAPQGRLTSPGSSDSVSAASSWGLGSRRHSSSDAASRRGSSQGARIPTSPRYEMPTTPSPGREDERLPFTPAVPPVIIPTQSRSEDRTQSQSPSLYAMPLRILIDSSDHHDRLSMSGSSVHQGAWSTSYGLEQNSSSSSGHHSTDPASSHLPHRIQQSIPSSPLFFLHSRVQDSAHALTDSPVALSPLPAPGHPGQSPSSGSTTMGVAFPGVPVSIGSSDHTDRSPSGTTSRQGIYTSPAATGINDGLYSATERDTSGDIPEDASLSAPSTTTISSGKRTQVRQAPLSSVPDGMIGADSSQQDSATSYEINVEPPSPTPSYDKLAAPKLGLGVESTCPPRGPESEPLKLKLRDYLKAYVSDTLPRQLYLHLLLRLPYFYFSRVERIFKHADLTLDEIVEMALQSGAEDSKTFKSNMSINMSRHYYDSRDTFATDLSPGYRRLKKGWESFIDTMMKEWKTLNLVSALVLPAIMTMLQNQGIAKDPVTRYVAFWSLICALLSLLFCCLFTIRFAGMRKADRAAEWALEVQKSHSILWNPWVMLAVPVVWLAWSIITYIMCIMLFMWRASANLPPDHTFLVSSSTEFGFRLFICLVLGTGFLHGVLIVSTLRRYGTKMDEAWRLRIERYLANPAMLSPLPQLPPQYIPSPISPSPIHSIPYFSKRSLTSDTMPSTGPAIPTSMSSHPATPTEIVYIPRPEPPTALALIPTLDDSGSIRLPPPSELSGARTLSPAEWKRAPSPPLPRSPSSHERRKRITRSSKTQRSSSSSSTSPNRRRQRPQNLQFPSTPPTPTHISGVSERGQGGSRVPSPVIVDPSATGLQRSPSPWNSNTTGTPPPRSPSKLPSPLHPAERTSEEGEAGLHPFQGEEDYQGSGFTSLPPLAGHDIDPSVDLNLHPPHTDTTQSIEGGGRLEGIMPPEGHLPEVLHPDYPPLGRDQPN